MTDGQASSAAELTGGNRRLAILLAMAMFVLVVDTSLMNVSIAAVVEDLDTTVSGVQSAIALEALVSAAFILIGSKVGDLIGRKRAYVLGLLGYAIGALAMALSQSLTAIIVFWAIVGGLRRVAPAAGHAVADPRQLRRSGAEAGLRAGRCGGGDRGGGGAVARGVHHHLPVVAHRLPARGPDHPHRAVRDQARPGRAVHRLPPRRRRRCGALRPGHGRHRAGHPGMAGGWRSRRRAAADRCRRDGRAGLLAGAAQAAGQADADRPRSVPSGCCSGSASPSRRSSRSPWAA